MQNKQAQTRRWWIYPLADGTLQAAPDSPTWGGGGILVEDVLDRPNVIKHLASETLAANTAMLELGDCRRRLLEVEHERDRYRRALQKIHLIAWSPKVRTLARKALND